MQMSVTVLLLVHLRSFLSFSFHVVVVVVVVVSCVFSDMRIWFENALKLHFHTFSKCLGNFRK